MRKQLKPLRSKPIDYRRALQGTKRGLFLALGAALLLAGLGLAGAVRAAPPAQSPDRLPSAAQGEALWIENCASCHGISGRGDGPTAQSPQMADTPPPDFTDRGSARQRTPADLFRVTQEGRMDRLMPPWGGRLNDTQIWDVVAYVQTLATTPEDIAAGQAIYADSCAGCHADDGSGAIPGAPDLTDVESMAARSSQALYDAVSQGQGTMPAFADQLSEMERWQVVDYLRTFSYQPIARDGVIAGQVQNATTGQGAGSVEVMLRRWQTSSELAPLTTQTDTDGSYRFEGLETSSHAFYRAEVVYNDVAFPTELVSFEPGLTELSLPVNIYETTTSDENIRVERFHFIVIGNQPGFLSVLELYQFSNQGDRAYVGGVNQAGVRETVRIALPDGAQEATLQSGSIGVDFLETDEGLVATSPIVPGIETFETAFIYVVPYSEATLDLSRPMPYDTGSLNGLLMDVGAKLESDALSFEGERVAQGQTFLQYTGQNLRGGEIFSVRLADLDKIEFAAASEQPASSNVMPSTGLRQTTLLWMVLGLGGLVIAFGLLYPAWRPRLIGETPAGEIDPARERRRLLLTLAYLDRAYEAGDLNETVYRRARARRKAELSEIFRSTGDS